MCKAARQEAGASGVGPDSVSSQSGESKRFVDWVKAAWERIQMRRPDWLWMRAPFTPVTLSAGVSTFSAAEAGADRFLRWHLRSFSVYKLLSDETPMQYMVYEYFRERFLVGQQSPGRPLYFTVAPDMSIIVAPVPDSEYTVRGDYQKSPQELAADDDVPEMPAHHHMAIVWQALMWYARYESAAEIYDDAKANLTEMLYKIELEQLPQVQIGTETLVL